MGFKLLFQTFKNKLCLIFFKKYLSKYYCNYSIDKVVTFIIK